MQFQKYDLGNLESGKIVEVILKDNAANVQLLDSSNFYNYQNGRKYKYYGGYVTQSPFRITVPYNGRWYIAIDLGGYSGTVKSTVRVIN